MKVILKLLELSAHRAFPKAESEFNLLCSEDHVLTSKLAIEVHVPSSCQSEH